MNPPQIAAMVYPLFPIIFSLLIGIIALNKAKAYKKAELIAHD